MGRSNARVNRTVKALCGALDKMQVDYTIYRAETTSSVYIRINDRPGQRRTVVRVSDHIPITLGSLPKSHIPVLIRLGYKPWADYDLQEWYKCLNDLAAPIRCQEAKNIARRIQAEEEIRRKPQNNHFMEVMNNIAKKAIRKNAVKSRPPRTSRETKILRRVKVISRVLELAGDKFHLRLHSVADNMGTFFWYTECPKLSYLFLGFGKPQKMPPGADFINTIFYGYDGAQFPYARWRAAVHRLLVLTGSVTRAECVAFLDGIVADAAFISLRQMSL